MESYTFDYESQQGLIPLFLKQGASIVLIDASWKWKSREHRALVSDLLSTCEAAGITRIYRCVSHGNDDCEDFLLDTGTADFPLVLYGTSDGRNKNFESSIEARGGFTYFYEIDNNTIEQTIRNEFPLANVSQCLFVSGDRSSVGKSSSCLAILHNLVNVYHYQPQDIAYIKPVTQCEAEQPVSKFCEETGIEHIGIGPVVFYKGFTRAFLANETEDSQTLVQRAVAAVRELKARKKFVLVDGVGYPAVGSICGISNAHVASVLQAPVLLIGKSGVGDAVDSHNLNSAFFQFHGCHVLGSIFNKLNLDGFYSLDACKGSVGDYFAQYLPTQRAYGFVPKLDNPESTENWAQALGQSFHQYVQLDDLIGDVVLFEMHKAKDAQLQQLMKGEEPERSRSASMDIEMNTSATSHDNMQSQLQYSVNVSSAVNGSASKVPFTSAPRKSAVLKKRSREEIEQAAREKGASGG
jgi:dethiobiotin synthetase